MTNTVGLIGWPVEHSRSPAMHNAAFAALNLNWRYVLLPTPPDQLEAVIEQIRTGRFQGANVTIPHKQAVMPSLDEIDPAAQAVGAVNTIVRQGARLVGYNTDVLGFKRAILETGVEVKDQACAVLGAGGSARAVLYVLRELGAHITVYARDVEKARVMLNSVAGQGMPAERYSDPVELREAGARSGEESLARVGTPVDGRRDASLPARQVAQKGASDQVAPLAQLVRVNPDTSLIVNTTPVGLSPHVEASPWPADAPFPTHALIFDLLNNPPRTRFMQQAEQAGLRAVNGWKMLVHQGAAAFEKWTGVAPPIEVMKQALEQSMKAE